MPAVESFVKCQVACILLDPRRGASLFTGFATCAPVSSPHRMRQASRLTPSNSYFLKPEGKSEIKETQGKIRDQKGNIFTTQPSWVGSAHV